MMTEFMQLKQNFELRAMARAQLKGNWGKAILALFLVSLLSGCAGVLRDNYGSLIALIIAGPFALGLCSFLIKMVRSEHAALSNIFDGFKNFVPALILYLLILVFTLLWTLLFFIPGIIAGYRYSQAFYILHDHPEMKASDAFRLSKEMMVGRKWKLFTLHLSFIGWFLLCILTLCIGFLWLYPYVTLATAHFYEDLKKHSLGNTPTGSSNTFSI
jgi:uncharacterized membrane protein